MSRELRPDTETVFDEFEWNNSPRLLDMKALSEDEIDNGRPLVVNKDFLTELKEKTSHLFPPAILPTSAPPPIPTNQAKTPSPNIFQMWKNASNPIYESAKDPVMQRKIGQSLPPQTEIKHLMHPDEVIGQQTLSDFVLDKTSPSESSYTTIDRIREKTYSYDVTKSVQKDETVTTTCSSSSSTFVNHGRSKRRSQTKTPATIATTVSVSTCPLCGPESKLSEQHCLFCCRQLKTASKVRKSQTRKSNDKGNANTITSHTNNNNHINNNHHHHQRLTERTSPCHCSNNRDQLKLCRACKLKNRGIGHENRCHNGSGDYKHGGDSYIFETSLTSTATAGTVESCCECNAKFHSNGLCCIHGIHNGDHTLKVPMTNGNSLDGSSSQIALWPTNKKLDGLSGSKGRGQEKFLLMTVAGLAIIVFLSVSYFGALLFLRLTRLPSTDDSIED